MVDNFSPYLVILDKQISKISPTMVEILVNFLAISDT